LFHWLKPNGKGYLLIAINIFLLLSVLTDILLFVPLAEAKWQKKSLLKRMSLK